MVESVMEPIQDDPIKRTRGTYGTPETFEDITPEPIQDDPKCGAGVLTTPCHLPKGHAGWHLGYVGGATKSWASEGEPIQDDIELLRKLIDRRRYDHRGHAAELDAALDRLVAERDRLQSEIEELKRADGK
jgi:hypothetical protein